MHTSSEKVTVYSNRSKPSDTGVFSIVITLVLNLATILVQSLSYPHKKAKAVVVLLSSSRYYIDNSPFSPDLWRPLYVAMDQDVLQRSNFCMVGGGFSRNIFRVSLHTGKVADALSRFAVVRAGLTNFHGAMNVWAALLAHLKFAEGV